MSANGWLQFAIYSVILLATVRPVGIYLTRVLEGERTWLDPVLRPFERLIYKLCGVKADKEMNWREYTFAMLGFSAVGLVLTYAIERLQYYLPWNPQHLTAVGTDLAFKHARHVNADRTHRQQQNDRVDGKLQPAVCGHVRTSPGTAVRR